MSNRREGELEDWRRKISDRGIASVRAEVATMLEANRVIALVAITEYEEIQLAARHSEQMGKLDDALKEQEKGNNIQWGVLAVLVVTMLVAITTCRRG